MRSRSLIASMSVTALLSGLTVLLPAATAEAANSSVCNAYCDARDPALAAGDRTAATATVWSRSITLHFDDADDMAWADVANGSPTDEVWIDRSFDGGQTFASGNMLGDTTIPAGDTSWRTQMYNVDNPSAHGVGAVRACGKAGDRADVACTPWLRSTTHAATPTAASITALMQYFNPSTGSWSGGPSWQDANAMTDLLDYITLSGDSTYAYAIPLIYADQGGAQFTDAYIDDTGWWGLAWLRAYQYTGNSAYLQTAEYDANFMNQYWDTGTCGGGVWWSTAKTAKNAIANELFLELNASLHNAISGDTTFLSRAQTEWTWFSKTGMINSQNLVNDGLNLSTCKNDNNPTYTYNQGVILAGLSQLNIAAPNSSLLTTANSIATAATAHLVSNGVLVDACEPNGCANDGYSFKGVFVRDLSEFARTTNTTAYNSFLNAQAASITAKDTNGDGQSGLQWAGPLNNVNYPDQQSASDAFNATLKLPTGSGTPPPPPPTTPTGAITGYSGLCVDDWAASTADGNKIDIYTCNGTSAQQWTVETNQTLQALGKCLDVTGGATADGTLVELYTCNGTGAQTWQHQANGELLNPNSGKCLDDPGFSTATGTQLDIWDCNAGANQIWSIP
ncbi:MAG TPA: glycoside hydrolase family 76 protein [Actinocrinis sp.]|nr:glycoside hydrolase family 76 protein [Actinocrinis sp.]